ncbi:MAG: flagellar hook-associated protein FlgL [Proteobacteria bacterium]|nr:flagellar hook-associated protein FlgL [Pseudomonadota bacterium]MBU4471540.1 flagellar hook-associated protein FlgL [Pseudomonadota bacterium]MCG2752546.1 flagellar hook-associated protein FlgL [Desulfobacteraceae bacterium]
MMTNSMSVSLQKKTQSLIDLSEKVSTGKRVLRPSDDPLGMARILDYRGTLSQIEQYMENINRGQTKIEVMEHVLGEVENQVINAKRIATDQSTGVLETRGTAASQIKNIFDQVLDLANSELQNNFLFGGNQTNARPFTRNADGIEGTADDYEVVYHGDNGEQKIIIGKNSDVKISSNGNDIFTGDTLSNGVNVFNTLKDLIEGLENPDTETGTTQIRSQLGLLKTAQEQVNSVRTLTAGINQRLTSSKDYWSNFKTAMETQLSNVQDVDLTQAAVEFQKAQLVYETTVALANEMLQNTLLSFLK